MKWDIKYLPNALKDLEGLDNSQRFLARKAIQKISKNPLPYTERGYGKPLGNKDNANLSGFLKVKIKASGLRIVYKLLRIDNSILLIVIGMGKDDEVYEVAKKRIDHTRI